jgi:hypothetical protein
MGFSIINHPAIGVTPFLETLIYVHQYISKWDIPKLGQVPEGHPHDPPSIIDAS